MEEGRARHPPAPGAPPLAHVVQARDRAPARAESAASPKLRLVYAQKASKIRATDLADLRAAYQAERVNEIAAARRFELTSAVPGIVWLTA